MRFVIPLLLILATYSSVQADSPTAQRTSFDTRRDIPFAEIAGQTLSLDLYVPRAAKPSPLIVWVHGGAWRAGSRDDMPLTRLVEQGYAIASVDYRLSPVARFPAQVHDIKAAIRFLRAKQDEWNIDTRRVGIAGSSAGGHLAALVGTTNGHPRLEGTVGAHPGESSAVQAIVSYYGPTNFLTILRQSTPHGLRVREPAFELLLGGQPDAQLELARLASPVVHVDAAGPPLLLLHGDQDPQVPINQSHELDGAYQQLGLDSRLVVVHGGVHGGPLFFDPDRLDLVKSFFDRHLAGDAR